MIETHFFCPDPIAPEVSWSLCDDSKPVGGWRVGNWTKAIKLTHQAPIKVVTAPGHLSLQA